MKRMIRIVALLMAALMTVTSCQDPDSVSQLTSEIVDVSFAGPSARTITTDDGLVQIIPTSDLWFQYKAVWQGEDPIPSTATNEWTGLPGPGLSSTVKLHRGRWNLSLRAFVNQSDVDSDDKFILSGTREGVEIGTNNMVTQTVSISLGYVRQEGNGTLHISATYPVVYREGTNPEEPVEAVRKVKVTANVSGTDYTGEITAFDSNNVGSLDLTVPAGAAHVTVQYYMDDSTLFEGDQVSKDVLIMATMTTNLAVSVDRDITAITFKAGQPEGSVEDNYVILHSMFDVFPDTATASDCVVGYRLATDEAVSYPCVLSSAASPNEKGQYNATDLGLEPVIVTPLEMVQNGQANGWDKAWVGPDAIISEEDAATLNVENGDGMALKEIHFTGVSYAQGVWGAFAPGKVVNFSCGNLVNLEKVVLPDDIEFLLPGQFTNCMRLKDINFPASLQGAPFYVFLNCISLADININSNITTVDNGAGLPYDGSLIDIGFADTNPIYQEIIQDVLNTRGEDPYTWQYNYTFGPGVSQLWRVVSRFSTSFVIPEGIEELHHTFEGCERLTIDGITFPSTLKVIEEHTFGGCLGFTGTFEIPETVEKLGSNVFTGCDNLEKVVIPTSVTELTGNPFGVDRSDNYPGTVEYKGTMEQWNQITGASNVTTHAITCSDGVISKP